MDGGGGEGVKAPIQAIEGGHPPPPQAANIEWNRITFTLIYVKTELYKSVCTILSEIFL